MKLHHLRATLPVLLIAFAMSLAAQNLVITGIAKSAQTGSSLREVEISFYDAQNRLLGDCGADSKGRFTSDRIFKAGQSVTIKITAPGFADYTGVHTVRNTVGGSNAGTLPLQPLLAFSGVVKTDQGAFVAGATLSFFNQAGQLLSTCYTDINGKYKSDKMFKSGESLTITAKRPGLSEESAKRQVDIARPASQVVDFNLKTSTVISGFVSDSVALDPLPGVEVSFFDKDGRLIDTRPTNQQGYYDFETDFTFGEIIKVRVGKKDYVTIE